MVFALADMRTQEDNRCEEVQWTKKKARCYQS